MYKRTRRTITVLVIVAVISTLIVSNFDLTKMLQIKSGTDHYLLPVPVVFPLFFIFLYVNLRYIKFSYAEGKTILQKVIFGTINLLITAFLFVGGFEFWKFSQGDIDVAFFGETKDAFEMSFRNIYFWVLFQTLLMVYGLSILKILVSKTKKK